MKNLLWKHSFDVIISILLLPIVVPIIILTCVWIYIVSWGTAFFIQERVGIGGKTFRCYKLRTMKLNSNTDEHKNHFKECAQSNKSMNKLDNHDKRLILGAKIIRALGIDELPQIFNVLEGTMSIIGPRPPIPYEVEHYKPWQTQRFNTLPGLTGLWQISGKNDTTLDKMIDLDIRYVKQQSIWLDMWILLMTPKTIFEQMCRIFKR